MKLTPRQDEVLQFIWRYFRERGGPPTRVEIAREFGFWPNAAECHVRALRARGFISLGMRGKRNIQLAAP